MQFLAYDTGELQNVYTPFPLWAHVLLAAIAAVTFFVQYYRKGGIHYILMITATAATLITQLPGFATNHALIIILELGELILVLLLVILLVYHCVKRHRKKKSEAAEKLLAELEQKKQAAAEQKKREDIQKGEDNDPVGYAFDDDEDL